MAISTSTEKLVWWILGIGSSLVGVLGLMILSIITENIKEVRAQQVVLISRIGILESVVYERTGPKPSGVSPQSAH
jgi:hypothetical protein